MVSTEKCYNFDNTPVLDSSVRRGEYLYHVRVYMERASFLAPQAGNTRLRVLLGFIEAKAAVIDAVIKSEDTLHYLSLICSSTASPEVFSAVMRRTATGAIIEQIDRWQARERVAARMVRTESWSSIPFAPAVRTVHDSRLILISLLLEYRSLMCEVTSKLGCEAREVDRTEVTDTSLAIPILMFESEGRICGIPEFHVERLSEGANGQALILLKRESGQRVIMCNDLLAVRDINAVSLRFIDVVRRGMYSVQGNRESFTLVVPSLL